MGNPLAALVVAEAVVRDAPITPRRPGLERSRAETVPPEKSRRRRRSERRALRARKPAIT